MTSLRHRDQTKYIVEVLWFKGHTQAAIATWLNLTRKQVAGICDRSDYGKRSDMEPIDRQVILSELFEMRYREDGSTFDGGYLKDFDWVTLPLEREQKRGRHNSKT